MRFALLLGSSVLAATLAACGGGSGGGSTVPTAPVTQTTAPAVTPTTAPTVGPTTAPTVSATTAPTVAPTTAPTTAPAPLATAQLGSSAGFIAATGRTAYVFDLDGNNVSNCSGGCSAAWPAIVATAASYTAPWSAITRSDGTRQLAYNGHPLYVCVGDVANGTTNGDNLVEFGATWHVARPALGVAAGAPTPGPTDPPGTVGY